MSPVDADHFTGMDGNAIEDSPEPLPCPFCGSGADQLVVERWSAEDLSRHLPSRGVPQVRLQRSPGRDTARGCGRMERAKRVDGAVSGNGYGIRGVT